MLEAAAGTDVTAALNVSPGCLTIAEHFFAGAAARSPAAIGYKRGEMLPPMNANASLRRLTRGDAGSARRCGAPLPEEVRRDAEAILGEDLSSVYVHVSLAPVRMGAAAFTAGSDIYFAPHRYDPGSPDGLRLLGHELAHVVQQRRGRVRNPHGYGVAVVRDPVLEAEADRVGRALQMARQAPAAAGPHRRAVQCASDTMQVYLKLSSAPPITLYLTPEQRADCAAFYAAARGVLVGRYPALGGNAIRFSFGGKQVPTAGVWPEVSPETVPSSGTTYTVVIGGKLEEPVDEALVKLAHAVEPNLIIPNSQIDDTHVNDPDVVVTKHGCLSIDNLRRQQKLDLVLDALKGGASFSLMLIDPSFAPNSDQTQMVQIVTYLRDLGYEFTEEVVEVPRATIHRCGKVTITYVGEKVNAATLEVLGKSFTVGSIAD